jgi:ABC-type transport system involved in cytochrome bd biosynthesis fused ATPase/permease subunit
MKLRRLRRWLSRSRPSPARLTAAITVSALAALASIVLLGGSGLLVGRAAGGGGLATLGGLLVLVELVAFLRAPLRFEERLITHRVALGSMVRWRTWLYDTVVPRSPGALSFVSSGDLLDRAIEDIDTLEDLYVRVALPVLGASIAAALAAALIVWVAPLAALLVLLGLVGCLSVSLVVSSASASAAREATALRAMSSALLVDLLDGSAELVMAQASMQASERIERTEATGAGCEAVLARLRGLGIALVGLINAAVLLGVTLLAASKVHHGGLSPAEAAGLSLVAVAGMEPMLGCLFGFLRAADVDAAAARLEELEASSISTEEPERPTSWPLGERSIWLRQVTAAPSRGEAPILRELSLSLPPGRRVAIVGASGSGKSTLCRLLMRFLDPLEGSILVGSTPFTAMLGDEVRRHVVMLDQSPTLFAGNLADTLRLGDERASDDELVAVLHACQLGELLPEGALSLSRPITEEGASLSLGQQRRLALARVLLRAPEIMVLDEPTAGLDDEQASTVLASALSLAPQATVLLATHQLTLAEQLDEVYWLHDGALERIADPLARLSAS